MRRMMHHFDHPAHRSILRRRVPPWFAVALLAASVLVGCADDSERSAVQLRPTTTLDAPPEKLADDAAPDPAPDAPAPGVSADPCAVLTPAEVVELAGTVLDPPVAADGMCTYSGPVTGPLAQVEVYVGPGAEKILEIDRDTLDHLFVPVTGIGDEATSEDGAIFVRVGTTWLAIRLVTLDDPALISPRLETAARAAAARIS